MVISLSIRTRPLSVLSIPGQYKRFPGVPPRLGGQNGLDRIGDGVHVRWDVHPHLPQLEENFCHLGHAQAQLQQLRSPGKHLLAPYRTWRSSCWTSPAPGRRTWQCPPCCGRPAGRWCPSFCGTPSSRPGSHPGPRGPGPRRARPAPGPAGLHGHDARHGHPALLAAGQLKGAAFQQGLVQADKGGGFVHPACRSRPRPGPCSWGRRRCPYSTFSSNSWYSGYWNTRPVRKRKSRIFSGSAHRSRAVNIDFAAGGLVQAVHVR